ncbi:cardiolipin synthase [Halieaceae bacterium IMCC14734]|uniref:Cardiolipin synthase n=1 Tax=Candidatus Litorirhabdus singularis TaxID=2518993 RepID=A0ABT3TG82_9GAMM|nr:cardiolipin synthase [Candidatus Litorirhabdus singularis]MCX2980776.1 cardiolipin synthase [Candidatus Litorirhabdus singularis]
MTQSLFFLLLHLLAVGAVVVRILLRPHREPAARLAWLAVVGSLPVLGVLAYLLLGETNIGRRNRNSMDKAIEELPQPITVDDPLVQVPPNYMHLFRVGTSISGFRPVAGNHAELMADSNATIQHMVADIDAATEQVNLLFYIWLTDNNGSRMAEALKRAAGRGVTCRAMVDALGSRALLRSRLWREMAESGVKTAVALPLGNPLLRPLQGRIDLRNHRKILVIDGRVTFCGSQNCADPEFRVKAKYAPWVDSVIRLTGPVVRQNQLLFATDWMTYTGEDLHAHSEQTTPALAGNTVAQVVASGPTLRHSAMSEMFESLIFGAREELVISTPYYVPDQSMQSALCAAAYRGVHTTLILPARNDSIEVAAASRSYYADLLDAGVELLEYEGGLLHSKTLTLDGQITLIGSANMDRRSFDLNYENNILLYDPELTRTIRERQQVYIDSSIVVSKQAVENWSLGRRLWNNSIAILGPVL